jgi:NADH:ubiquinone reductase (H+-translocating)
MESTLEVVMTDRKRIVILGAGFGGLFCSLKLAAQPVDVILIDRNDFHTFQPLIYQVATGTLDAVTVGHPVRDLLHKHKNVTFHVAKVLDVDFGAREVHVSGMGPVSYDYLVIGLGSVANDFGIPGVADHAFPLYTLDDAVRLRSHVLLAFEAADKNPELIEDGELTFAIVGGGPTGIETAGAMVELIATSLAEDFPNLDMAQSRVVLIQRESMLLPPFDPKLQAYAEETLKDRGVDLRLNEAVTEVNSTHLVLDSGETIPARTVIWAGGLKSNPVVEKLDIDLVRGRIPVSPDLSIADHPEVFAVGDCAAVMSEDGERALPQLASVAKQAGEYVAGSIKRQLADKPVKPFHYSDRGIMATIGRRAAVIQMPGGHTITGTPAWAAWAGVHLALLSGAESRVTAVLDWSWSMFTHQHRSRIVLNRDEEEDQSS